jgi:hypothetical protein
LDYLDFDLLCFPPSAFRRPWFHPPSIIHSVLCLLLFGFLISFLLSCLLLIHTFSLLLGDLMLLFNGTWPLAQFGNFFPDAGSLDFDCHFLGAAVTEKDLDELRHVRVKSVHSVGPYPLLFVSLYNLLNAGFPVLVSLSFWTAFVRQRPALQQTLQKSLFVGHKQILWVTEPVD